MDPNILKNIGQLDHDLNFTKLAEVTDFIKNFDQPKYQQIVDANHLNNLSLKERQLLVESIAVNVLVRNDHDFNHRLTPPAIGLIFSEIISLLADEQSVELVDFGGGTGSLTFSILANLQNDQINATLIDNNEEFFDFSNEYRPLFSFGNATEQVFDDVVSYNFSKKADFLVSDVPVGYYPQTQGLDDFQVKDNDNLTYVQNLFIERSIQILNDNGFAIMAVPQNIFTSEQSGVLLRMLRESAYIQGIISLPLNSFTDHKFVKNIIILQKHGDNAKQITPVLIYQLADIEDLKSYQKLFSTLKAWSREIKYI
ncbi:class I SAM-dependent methyltransferase [Xylocopilactobacillus apicola]|uniref:DNA methyltransferase n=1 Tax=Xylocopilactobacillus apicola TaxID=2932184 RepID=A0AAU9DT80_9LACO|nr:class I SAM-dependent methyltransferase [Xylocopilactobacillus apicola]BDR58568.1 DNA methyltransferase [Xylocopilactobacillus apicola]